MTCPWSFNWCHTEQKPKSICRRYRRNSLTVGLAWLEFRDLRNAGADSSTSILPIFSSSWRAPMPTSTNYSSSSNPRTVGVASPIAFSWSIPYLDRSSPPTTCCSRGLLLDSRGLATSRILTFLLFLLSHSIFCRLTFGLWDCILLVVLFFISSSSVYSLCFLVDILLFLAFLWFPPRSRLAMVVYFISIISQTITPPSSTSVLLLVDDGNTIGHVPLCKKHSHASWLFLQWAFKNCSHCSWLLF